MKIEEIRGTFPFSGILLVFSHSDLHFSRISSYFCIGRAGIMVKLPPGPHGVEPLAGGYGSTPLQSHRICRYLPGNHVVLGLIVMITANFD